LRGSRVIYFPKYGFENNGKGKQEEGRIKEGKGERSRKGNRGKNCSRAKSNEI